PSPSRPPRTTECGVWGGWKPPSATTRSSRRPSRVRRPAGTACSRTGLSTAPPGRPAVTPRAWPSSGSPRRCAGSWRAPPPGPGRWRCGTSPPAGATAGSWRVPSRSPGPGQMALRDIPSSWRDSRILVRLVPVHRAQFLDLETEETRAVLARELRTELQAFDIEGPLTDEHLHGRDRNVTRQIAAWAVSRRNQDQHQLFQGLTYRSSYGGRRCWAIWRDTELKEVERRPIQVEDPALREVAEEYGLTVR